ncbi:hypothetical protein JD505_07860 [Aeromonas hydrophila]|uniref:hypothetical protein n=1 Tax=Aeromonas hydrophila TaxID=644 RepID=UPI00191D6D5D|nr:hypothetical protein [Aeromonas hydrophila]MBL0569190.1 hypothetical protein [Aeromonas hydrophila]
MKGRVSVPTVVSACIEGIANAQNQYVSMSGGDWVYWAPEYFITSSIAQSLHNASGKKYITIENGAYDALYYAGAIGQGRLHRDIRPSGRFDLLLWWAKGHPRAVIEVKNRVFNRSQYESDLKRIVAVISRKKDNSTMEFGAFAFYSATGDSPKKSSRNILEQRKKIIENNAKKIVGNQFKVTLHTSEIIVDDEHAWFAGCILIENY